MVVFKWKATSVWIQIHDLEDEDDREKARCAYAWLRDSEESCYLEFDDEHLEFLAEYPKPTEQQCKRWLRFIERVGVECACWPHLFWDKNLCFSQERFSDPRRAKKQRKLDNLEKRLAWDSHNADPYADAEDDDPIDDVNHSVRRLYQSMALSPLIDYSLSYDILHYVYDLLLWSSIGAKKAIGGTAPMRVLMQDHPMSPMYWHKLHLALVDMVRQCGYPRLWFTIAPYEGSFPYHFFIQDEIEKALRARVHLPHAETLHMTHVMTQTVVGVLCGHSKPDALRKNTWKRHILFAKDAHGKDVKVAFMLRIEFQDGTHKAPTQDYHGSGKAHIHAVICVSSPEDLGLETKASVHLPEDDDDLRGYVEGSQLDRNGETGWDIHEGPSRWNKDDGGHFQLQHTEDDKCSGVRGFFSDIMDTLQCHQDFQEANDDGALRRYLVKYPCKMSDSSSEEWLNDAHSGDSIAQAVLFRYKPLEPEMILQLHGHKFRQWHFSTIDGGKKDFRVPVPDATDVPKEVRMYEESTWRSPDMSLLDFLRRSNNNGDIIYWLKKAHKTATTDGTTILDLNDFACQYKLFGEKIVAADILSWRNDKHHGQWLVLHVPFKKMIDFVNPVVDAKVPKQHRYLGMALLCNHRVATRLWRSDNEDILREELRLYGFGIAYTTSIINQIGAEISLVTDYLQDRIVALPVMPGGNDDDGHGERSFPIKPEYELDIANARKWVEGRIDSGEAAQVKEGDTILLGRTRVLVTKISKHASFRAMLQDCTLRACLPSCRSIEKGIKTYHSFRNYENKAKQSGVVAFHIEPVENFGPIDMKSLNHEQRRYVQALNDGVDHALAVHAATDAEAQRLIQNHRPKVQVCFGAPGVGKTAVTYLAVDYALQQGGYVLFAVYTAQMASRIRILFAKHPLKSQIRIDTCHACFGLDQEFINSPILYEYALIIVDEIGQLDAQHTDAIINLRNFVDCVPALAFIGDKWQMAGFGDNRPWDTVLWKRATFRHDLFQQFRCKDPGFQKILDLIRTNKPEGRAWSTLKHEFLRSNKAWKGDEPTVEDIRWLMTKHPEATFLAITRKGVERLNELAVLAKFPRKEPLATIGGDLESNPDNWFNKKLRSKQLLVPLPLKIYKGMQLYMTRNVMKDCQLRSLR